MPAYFRSTLGEFLTFNPDDILGRLCTPGSELTDQQRNTWHAEIQLQRTVFESLIDDMPTAGNWVVLMEYPVPRLSSRIDAVLLADDIIFVIEYKIAQTRKSKGFKSEDVRQVEHYALDLHDFHAGSQTAPIVPILCVTKAIPDTTSTSFDDNRIQAPILVNEQTLHRSVRQAYQEIHDDSAPRIAPNEWDSAPYNPIPTVIEGARLAYNGHRVSDISKHRAHNLTETTDALRDIIKHARESKKKAICFVTGIPGAGKTLVGLNIVHDPGIEQLADIKSLQQGGATCFLTGNEPLVKVLTAALAGDHKERIKQELGKSETKDKAKRQFRFVQSVHKFIAAEYCKTQGPAENLIVFDEAQRAYDQDKMRRRQARSRAKATKTEPRSEPAMILEIMSRHDWAVIVALVGGGQEINDGEAGLGEWGRVLKNSHPEWNIHIPPQYLRAQGSDNLFLRLFDQDENFQNMTIEPSPILHLEVAIRARTCDDISNWVNSMIEGNSTDARSIADKYSDRFPVFLTRELPQARRWLRSSCRGQKRCGLLASSGAERLRAEGLEVKHTDHSVEAWFLNPPEDVRSSNALEIVMTEFQCQGLELDFVGVCWGADFIRNPTNGDWLYRELANGKRTAWRNIEARKNSNRDWRRDRLYLANTYRVLMTRAREGMIIWVPKGNTDDPTRQPEFYDGTADYLIKCGVIPVDTSPSCTSRSAAHPSA